MGTRSLTKVIQTWKDEDTNKQRKQTLINMYRQMDGYPSGMGMDLAEFLKGGKVVNGMGLNDVDKPLIFNGAGCLAAQIVAHFKEGAGSIYMQHINAKDCWQNYEYEIVVDDDNKEITFNCITIGYMDSKGKYRNGKKVLFSGKVEDFIELVEKDELEKA